jgi:hypothetical protein
MRPRYALLLTALFACASLPAQTVLFQSGFEEMPPVFNLNTTDVSSQASGANTWLINTMYAGGSTTVDCLGFPFLVNIPSTPAQPAGVPNANGNYLHVASTAAVAGGILCCSFAAADGFCTPAGNHFARMGSDVSTLGHDQVSLSFWWLCSGSPQHYGEVYYSTNGGSSWTLITAPIAQYRDQPTWAQQSISLPAFANQASLRFGFRFVNGTSLSAADPGFAVDALSLTSAVAQNTVSTPLSTSGICMGSAVQVPYTATGSFQNGNIFTAWLSDANGGFGQPTAIGSLAATGSGTIAATIPTGLPAGANYRIRVDASLPPVVGTDNGSAMLLQAPPDAGSSAAAVVCANNSAYSLVDGLAGTPDAGGTWTYNGMVSGGVIDAAGYAPGTHIFVYTVEGAVPCPAASSTLTLLVDPCAGIAVLTSRPVITIRSHTQGLLVLEADREIDRVAVWNVLGERMALQVNEQRSRTAAMPVGHLSPGVYLFEVHTATGSAVVRALIH